MHRTMALAIAVLLTLSVLVSCGGGWIVDDAMKTTITFAGNGATSGEMEVQEVGKGIPTRISANCFGKTDRDFIGWNTEPDGSGTEYLDGQFVSITENITLYAQWGIFLTDGMTSWSGDNKYVLNSDITYESRVSVSNSPTLVLRDGYTLNATNGISVDEYNSLTITAQGAGTGKLIASATYWNTGIGGQNCEGTGTIIINGGTVYAYGGGDCPGIGASDEGSVGTIIINGGTVYAYGGQYAAGIGSGTAPYGGGSITINGGTVNAFGGGLGAGIGTGTEHSYNISLVINDGTVTATGGSGGAGIGGGFCGQGIDVTINGGTVIATGGEYNSSFGMGIGNGFGSSSDGTLTLGPGVALQVSTDNTDWSAYDGTTRTRYMKTI